MNIRLALSGSGFLAPAHVGFVCALLDNNFKIVEVAGTSGGSIVASAIAIGMNRQELSNLAFEQLPKGIADLSWFSIFKSLFDIPYANDGKILSQWLNEKFGMVQFNSTKIPLTVIASNITHSTTMVFNNQTFPNLKLSFACRASSSVPFFYAPINYANSVLVDGGVRANIPTNFLQDSAIRIGVRITGKESSASTQGLVNYSKQLIGSMLDANEDDLQSWAESTGAIISDVNSDPYDFLNANLNHDAKLDLFRRGYKSGLATITSIVHKNTKLNINPEQ